MDYDKYNLEDFLSDPEFRDWVLNPDQVSCLFWEKWLGANPSKKNTIFAAKEILLSFKFRTDDKVDDKEQEQLLKSIFGKGQL